MFPNGLWVLDRGHWESFCLPYSNKNNKNKTAAAAAATTTNTNNVTNIITTRETAN
jgi:hypothetical protein